MLFASVTFWMLLFYGDEELSGRTRLILAASWLAFFGLRYVSDLAYFAYTPVVAITDAILVLVVFKGDIQIR